MFRPLDHHEPITCNMRHKQKHKHALLLSTIPHITVNQSVNVQIDLCYKRGRGDIEPDVLTVI
jgi:hypothetical protein